MDLDAPMTTPLVASGRIPHGRGGSNSGVYDFCHCALFLMHGADVFSPNVQRLLADPAFKLHATRIETRIEAVATEAGARQVVDAIPGLRWTEDAARVVADGKSHTRQAGTCQGNLVSPV